MQSKKIAFVVKYFPSVSETFIVNQINGLIDNGYSVRLFAYNRMDTDVVHESYHKHDLLRRVDYFVKPPSSKVKRVLVFVRWVLKYFLKIRWGRFFKTLNFFRHGRDAYTLKLFFESQWFLVSDDFNIIHSHFGMNGNRIAFLKAHSIIPEHTRLLTTFHGYDLEPNRLSQYKVEYAHLFRNNDGFTVNTPYLKDLLDRVNQFNIPVHMLPVGLDTHYFKRQGIVKDTSNFDLVFCGKLIPLKGPDLAIDIVRSLHDKGHNQVRLHMVGQGVMRDQLVNQVKELDLENKVIFHGAKLQTQLKSILEMARAFILPGRFDVETGRAETQGLVIQEAQAMELPVIISDVGGMKYGMLPNKSGFVIPVEDMEGFTKVIETLILNPKLKENMGRAGRLFVEKYYDNQVLTKQLIDIYRNIPIK